MSDTTNQFKKIYEEGKEYLKLRIEYGKLTVTEKLIMIISSLALGLICVFLGVVALFFLSLSAVDWMALSIGHGWATLIMCGIYLVIILVLVLLRKPLFVNPIARLISRIILK